MPVRLRLPAVRKPVVAPVLVGAHGGVMETPAKAPAGTRQAITVRLVGGPTALIEIGGLWLLPAPAFAALGLITGGSRSLAKAGGPGADASESGAIHAVLLSHD